ncbi:hypothetical protein [Sodalis sp.]|uniref:hypothetical protein n=1 Tax=Sodalis sp. (in: enterobacteria) TaxID=1898979 RepID=UPI00387322CA
MDIPLVFQLELTLTRRPGGVVCVSGQWEIIDAEFAVVGNRFTQRHFEIFGGLLALLLRRPATAITSLKRHHRGYKIGIGFF